MVYVWGGVVLCSLTIRIEGEPWLVGGEEELEGGVVLGPQRNEFREGVLPLVEEVGVWFSVGLGPERSARVGVHGGGHFPGTSPWSPPLLSSHQGEEEEEEGGQHAPTPYPYTSPPHFSIPLFREVTGSKKTH